VQIFTEARPKASPSMCSTPPSSSPKNWCRCAGRPHGARPQPRQLLRRDRAGRLLPAHVVPGIDFSNDPLLQGRIHLLPRHPALPAGWPQLPRDPDQRAAGARSTTTSATGCTARPSPAAGSAYEPNSLGGGCPFQAGAAGFVSFPQTLEGDKLRGKPEKFADHYAKPPCSMRARPQSKRRTAFASN
jgi:catalase